MRIDDHKTPNNGVGAAGIVVHNVHILDASGSMSGGKYTNALIGINAELKKLVQDSKGLNMTQTVIEFSGGGWPLGKRWNGETYSEARNVQGEVATHYFMTPVANCIAVEGNGAHGGTPLYQTVGETIEKLLKHVNPGEKVIMTIFTDGQELHSRGIYATGVELKKLIKKVEEEHNFTVTYMGTQQDIEVIVDRLNVDRSNTLMHTNTAQSVGETYATRGASLQNYAMKVASGAPQVKLRKGFFKDVVKNEDKTE